MKFWVYILLMFVLLIPSYVYAVCPFCIGIALSGSLISKFIPGLRGIMISSLWMGFLLYAIMKYIYERIAIRLLTFPKGKKILIQVLLYLGAFCTYFLFLALIYFFSGRQLSRSWFFAYHSGFFLAMAGYELYHWLFDKSIKIKYGNVVFPVLLTLLGSIIIYFV